MSNTRQAAFFIIQIMNTTLHTREQLADLTTPVGLYLKVRQRYPEVLLLESSDYAKKENSYSFLCFDSLATIQMESGQVKVDDELKGMTLVEAIDTFLADHRVESSDALNRFNGVFGYSGYEAVSQYENIRLSKKQSDYPQLRYDFFRFIFVFDHYYERLYLLENQPEGSEAQIDDIIKLVQRQDHEVHNFSLLGEVSSNMEDDYFKNMVKQAKSHCQRGDVFQMVLSRRFSQAFKGDEFKVYRALRAINPSPYLFYFDYGAFKIFGSSPEAQIVVDGDHAEIHPIAGTFKRTGDTEKDAQLGQELLADPKENAEHIMLVDLARNDLGKHAQEVEVSQFKKLQYFSHVIHIVSKVTAKLLPGISPYQVFADTFPAGTLSGAPKYKAMQLIDKYEPTGRGYYGGAIGWMGFDQRLNHAIMIRSFVSNKGQLHFQAGAGIVIDSDPESELQEVNNKLGALRQALVLATTIN